MVIALITLYYPTEETVKNIQTIASQSNIVYLCDNSPKNNEFLFSKINNTKYIYFGKNLGLSSAFNTILKNENFSENDFIIFFDQDSKIETDHIKKLISEYEALESSNFKVGCIGPQYYNTSSKKIEMPKQKVKLNMYTYKVSSIITSSMLIKYKILKDIDFWNEKIFLDMADWDLCWRIIKSNYICCITEIITMKHTLGNGEKKIGNLRIKEGSPSRVYYQIRDSLRLLRKNYVPLKFKIRFLLMLTIRPIIHFIFLGNKMERFKYFSKGIHDFHKGIYGSL